MPAATELVSRQEERIRALLPRDYPGMPKLAVYSGLKV